MTPETTPLPGEFDPATPQCDWTPRRFAAEVFKQQAWVKERSDMTPVADMLEIDKQDVCVHRWKAVPCIDLKTRHSWAIAECINCGLKQGDPQNQNGVNWRDLPKIGKR